MGGEGQIVSGLKCARSSRVWGGGGGVNEWDCMRTIAVRPLTNWGTAPDCKRQYGVYVLTPRLYARAHTPTSMRKLQPQKNIQMPKWEAHTHDAADLSL
jgi:hypothetical protein